MNQVIKHLIWSLLLLLPGLCLNGNTEESTTVSFEQRRPESDTELRYWLENCLWHHGFSTEETTAALGLSEMEIKMTMKRLGMSKSAPDFSSKSEASLKVLPYPGGRHPRVGFLDGAIRPQRETKISIFTPWDPATYAVLDVPEAIWCQEGLYYLAHTHIPTVWSQKGTVLPKLDWIRHADGSYSLDRSFPDSVTLQAMIRPLKDSVVMQLSLFNGSSRTMKDLRVQNCVMFKGLQGWIPKDDSNLFKKGNTIACGDDEGTHWVITSWRPIHRLWVNPPVPCIHADPKFPDCPPGETQNIQGWFSFYEGRNIEDEMARIEDLEWWDWFITPKLSDKPQDP